MAQDLPEIKMIPPRAVSRDRKSHELGSVSPVKLEKKEDIQTPSGVDRREFFKAVIPASGKLLTDLLRGVSVAVGHVIEESKGASKRKSD